MSNTIIGKLVQVLQTVEGETAKGPWIKGGFVIEYGDEYPRKAAFTVFGEERVASINAVRVGQQIKVTFTPESREFNDRWYTDLRCTKIEVFQQPQPVATPTEQPSGGYPYAAPQHPDFEGPAKIVHDAVQSLKDAQHTIVPSAIPTAQPKPQQPAQQATLEMPKDDDDLPF